MTPTRSTLCLAMLSALLWSGCGPLESDFQFDPPQKKKQPERWGSNDNPNAFAPDLVYELANLPMSGQPATAPWPGSYWPTYQDSINYRWDGASSQSAAKKYELAFGVTGVEDAVSRNYGVDNNASRTECEQDSQCQSNIGETCAKRTGASKGRCIPSWWGLCHGWTPAAILEPEPQHAVELNGVQFKVNDIKALLTLLYTSSSVRFLSSRCSSNAETDSDDSNNVVYDPYGRPSAQCRDTNPGTFHVVATNFLGLRQKGFAEDRTWDDEVWNQPVRGFEVTSKQEIDYARANALIGATATGGQTVNQSGAVARNEWKQFGPYTVTPGSSFRVVMSGDNDSDLYLRFGAQPSATEYACRPYSGNSNETCDLPVPAAATQVYIAVNGYAERSSFSLSITYGGSAPTSYVFNRDAIKFFHIQMTTKYISESAPSTDGNLASVIDSYTRSDRYEYVLELDAAGKIMGGEWIGSSKQNHPDFLWLPTAQGGASMADGKITYANVKQLLDLSVATGGGGGGGGGGNTSGHATQSGSVGQGEWKHFGPFDVVAGGKLTALMTGGGDADLYVKVGSQPTLASYGCRPYQNGSNENCEVSGPGQVFVSVNGYTGPSPFNLDITWSAGTGGGGGGGGVISGHFTDSGHVDQAAWKQFGPFRARAGTTLVARLSSTSGDPDLYSRLGQQPTGSAFDCRSWNAGTADEQCSTNLTADQDVFVAINGYEAADYALEVSFTPAGN